MKQIIILILICMLNMLNLPKSKAQGLSLSFNLTEKDTLENMIADSKKYNISALTISGYVNDANTKYIQDLNQNGKLKDLDLSGLTYISANGQSRIAAKKTFYRKDTYVNNKENSRFDGLVEFLNEFGYPDAESINQNALGGAFYELIVTVEDIINEQSVKRTFSGMKGFFIRYGYFDYNKTIQKDFCSLMPKRIFDICSFATFITPNQLELLGGKDCTYRVKSCDEYVAGNNVKQISDNAFYDSHIGNLILHSAIDSIGAHAFENCSGNIPSDMMLNTKKIDKCAFKNSTCLNGNGETLNLQVTTIENSAFQNASLNYSIILKNLKELGDSAFMGSSVRSIEIGTNLFEIEDNTFANCSELKTIIGGSNISIIGNKSFFGCVKLEEFNPSEKLTTIGNEAFVDNFKLNSFSIPNATKTIGCAAFANSGLLKIHIGANVDYRRDIFKGCYKLEAYSVDTNNESLVSHNGVLFSKDRTKLLVYPYGKKEPIYEISNDVTEISDSAFYNVKILGSLVISEAVKKIGKTPFANSSIFEIKALPALLPNVTDNETGLDQSMVRLYVHEKDYSTYYIGKYWGDFKKIFILEKATSPEKVINVETAGSLPELVGFGNLFKYNTLRLSGYLDSDDIRYLREMAGRDVRGNKTSGVLKDLDFSLTSIVKGGSYYYIKNENSSGKLSTSDNIVGESMFEGCNFTSLAISESTTKIVDKALYGCQLESFILPAATKELNSNSFIGMATLKEFVVDSDNPNYLSLNGVLFTKDGKSLLLYPYAKPEERYSTPETTTSIGEHAFGGSHLKTIITNEGLKEIGTMAFNNLGSLEGISLPSTLETIGHRAFYGCNNLLDITCKAYYPPTLKYDSYSYYGQPYNNFSDKTYKNAVLFVPKKNGGYTSRSGWKLFNNVIESDDWMSGIQAISGSDNAEIIKSYDLNGRVVTSSYHGVSILKMSNGTTKKVFVK